MAHRISDLIIQGELYHTLPFSVHGIILLRGCPDPIAINLTGEPSADLAARAFQFHVPQNDFPPTDEDRRRARAIKNQQVGTPGEMTAARTFLNWTLDDLAMPPDFREPPVRKPGLYLEWYSQNGRVLIELIEPDLEFLEWTGKRPSLGAGQPSSLLEDDAEPGDEESDAPVNFMEVDLSGGDLADVQADAEDDPGGEEPEPNPEETGYGLIPDDLQRELERSTRRLDREMSGMAEHDNDSMEEFERLDDAIESGDGVPITECCPGLQFPDPKTVSTEEAAKEALTCALAELALFGIAFHICEHCNWREAYRIFHKEIGHEGKTYPEMRGSSWVQHFTTSDFCRACGAEDLDEA